LAWTFIAYVIVVAARFLLAMIYSVKFKSYFLNTRWITNPICWLQITPHSFVKNHNDFLAKEQDELAEETLEELLYMSESRKEFFPEFDDIWDVIESFRDWKK